VDSARRALTVGFDFIELHMAHCYTLGSFLSLANQRQDDYGGKLENRIRLPVAVYKAVRQCVGGNYPLGLRMNGDDFISKGNTLLHSIPIARRFAELGSDYISISAGDRFEDAVPPPPGQAPNNTTGYSGQRFSPPWWTPDGVNVYLADEIRQSLKAAGFNAPVVTVGKIRTPRLAERILQQGRADIIGLCRSLLCDPDWPKKAREGREKEIVHCAACNSCLGVDLQKHLPVCARWPENSMVAPDPFLPGKARPAKLA
jgi:2,4-dienoyl-CoA reductase-like NADH-dependent reductase (Old Yellow Enzyme family)